MHSLAPDDPDVREFDTTVERLDGSAVVLDRTYFYAESGGQPADRGTLDGVAVVDVQVRDDEVVHTLAAAPPFDAGDEVFGVVDDAFRTYCMRAHTASHVLYGAGRRLLDDLGYGGFDISPEKVRVDFTTTTPIDDATLVELERLVNRVVWDSLPVTWEEVPVEEATTRDDVAFNVKTEAGVMAESETVRLVEIDGWDVAACGGTHVSNTSELGLVEVLDRSNPGEGLTRVEFAVGPTAVERHATRHEAVQTAARELETNPAGLVDRVRSLKAETERLESSLSTMRAEVVASRIDALDVLNREGVRWHVGVVEAFDANEVGAQLRGAPGADEVYVVAGRSGSTFVVVASDSHVSAASVVHELTEEFDGGGGGSESFAQGGGLDADPDDVVASLQS